MSHFTLFFKRSNFTVGSFLISSMLLEVPCHAEKETATGDFKVSQEMTKLLYQNCFDCHDEHEQEGDIRLDQLEKLSLDARLDLMNMMQEKIYLRQMPPKDETIQPTDKERAEIVGWLSKELNKHNASKLEEKLRMPEYGNYVDHKELFSGKNKDLKPFTPDRRWLINEFIFDAKINGILVHNASRDIYGKRVGVLGDNNRGNVKITNPFLLPTNSGVRDYATGMLNGGHLLTMISNSKEIADLMIKRALADRRYLPSVSLVMDQENKDNQILASRQTFLNLFIDQVLNDLYKDKHASMLPKFVTTTGNDGYKINEKDGQQRVILHSALGRNELIEIFHAIRRLEKAGEPEPLLLEKCEKYWFNYGLNERELRTRILLMKNYIERMRLEFKVAQFDIRNPLPVYKPLADPEMAIIKETILAQRKNGDNYLQIIQKCMTAWQTDFKKKRDAAGAAPKEQIDSVVSELFVKIIERKPNPDEAEKYGVLAKKYLDELGNLNGIQKLIQTFFIRSDFAYRNEFGEGLADEHGRKMLSPRDASYAISYALTDSSPDAELQKAAESGKLNTREDYRREVTRLLAKRDQYYIIDESLKGVSSITNLPIRKLRFFREFFGYPKMLPIFKDDKRFGGQYIDAQHRLIEETDRLVEHILINDKNVFEELLTTDKFYVFHSGDNEAMTKSTQRLRKIYDYFKDLGWEKFTRDDLIKHKKFLTEMNIRGINANELEDKTRQDPTERFKRTMRSITLRFDQGETAGAPYVSFPSHGHGDAELLTGGALGGEQVAKFFNIKLDNWNYPSVQPAKVENRKGMLTHPAWLIAFSQNTETDPVIRGKWVREKLLAGRVPDIPITVDAVIPEDHTKSLRQRLVKRTEQKACWKCHVYMNPLGYAFETYDDFGRFRTEESIEHPENLITKMPDKGDAHVDLRDVFKTMKVDSKGKLVGTDDPSLDGEITDAIDLAERLGKSRKVRQSIIRYAFRYFMGRNEFISDSATLIDAERAYTESGGSFDAVIISLLTSDSFIYRKNTQ
jgi:hypothetical protein